jgi:Integrase core domain
VLDDFSRYILAWKLCTTMAATDESDMLQALEASGLDQVKVLHRPRLLSDNGPSYLSSELGEWLENKGIKHIRGRAYHPMTTLDGLKGRGKRGARTRLRPPSGRLSIWKSSRSCSKSPRWVAMETGHIPVFARSARIPIVCGCCSLHFSFSFIWESEVEFSIH